MATENLQYPVGKFNPPLNMDQAKREEYISSIEELPGMISNSAGLLSENLLNTSYRPGGWTARQVIHHLADSHCNAYLRFKLALTEDIPVIKPYLENRWAQLPDSSQAPVNSALDLLNAVHRKLVLVIKNMSQNDFERKYFHPESKTEFTLDTALAMYAWHGTHHHAHLLLVLNSSKNS